MNRREKPPTQLFAFDSIQIPQYMDILVLQNFISKHEIHLAYTL